MINGLEIITLRNFLFEGNWFLKLIGDERAVPEEIHNTFGRYVKEGLLSWAFNEGYVAFCGKLLCGHSEERPRILFDTAVSTYGSDRQISVYKIPENGDRSNEAILESVKGVLTNDPKIADAAQKMKY
jgi:hypothetical protein